MTSTSGVTLISVSDPIPEPPLLPVDIDMARRTSGARC